MNDRDMARARRIEIFQDTLDLCGSDPYLKQKIEAAKKATWVYYAEDYPLCGPNRDFDTEVTVTKHRTLEAAGLLKKADPVSRVAVLNFANAFRPGGGVTSGAGAQEECLCRCSTLYPLLRRRYLQEKFYDYHARIGDSKSTDAVIYTQGVVAFKSDTAEPELLDRRDWFTVDVMTCAAPDLRDHGNIHAPLQGAGAVMGPEELRNIHVRRAAHLLTVAAAHEADTLVLGAFGCGAFRNDPEVVAEAWRTALAAFRGVFRRIEFAVYCAPWDERNYEAFARELGCALQEGET